MDPRKLSLIAAVIHGDTEAVRASLAAGSDVNETGDGGRTPLILAILFRRPQIMTLLLEAGADPHQRDSLGLNAVDWAERKGLKLLEHGQARKLETASVTPNKEPVPFGGLTRSPEEQTTPSSRAPSQSASDDEKSRRWLAGMKRRIDEEASHKTKEVEPPRPPKTEVEATPENEPAIVVGDRLVEASTHEPEPAPSVDAERPLFASFTSQPETAWRSVVWLLVVFVLFFIVGAGIIYFMIPYK